MQNGSQLEIAENKMRDLLEKDFINKLRESNEATVRLLVIDEVLSILGWQKHEYNPEKVTSTSDYTDYRLTIDNDARLIVEAKRISTIEPFAKATQQSTYTNHYLYNRCGPAIKSLLDQCSRYCAQCGIQFALATTGEMWIILLGYQSGTEWGKLRAIVFHSLENILERFNEFYGLLSREAVKNNSLEVKFAETLPVKPSITIHPRQHIKHHSDIGQAPDRQIIRAFFDQFMGDITKPGQAKMLEQCYVENRELNNFSQELRQIIKYDALLDGSEISMDEANIATLQQELELQSTASHPKTILLVGNIGVGKSTFIHRFSKHEGQPKLDTRRVEEPIGLNSSKKALQAKQLNICAIVDLINHITTNIEHNRSEEQRLSELVLNSLASEFRDKDNPHDPNVIRRCFEVEINHFKRRRQMLFSLDLNSFLLEEEKYIYELSQDMRKHLIGYIKYIRKKQPNVWIAFDNVDRGSESYQSFVYSFAHKLSAEARCITLIALRQDTFLEAQEAGFLDVRSSDIVFHLNAPEIGQIIARRRKYVERIIEGNELPRSFQGHMDLVETLNWHITHLLLSNNNEIRYLLTTFSLNNIRYSLQTLRDYYISHHSTFHEFYKKYPNLASIDEDIQLNIGQETSRLLQALMLGNSWSYEENKSEIFNVFWANPSEQTSHFLILRILAYLSLEHHIASARITVEYDKVCSSLVSLGYQHHHVVNAIRRLLYAGLVVSPNLPDNSVTETRINLPDPLPNDMKIAISGRGHLYLNYIASHEYYQTRVAEDTIWYDMDSANNYIKCLQDSASAQDNGTEDVLLVTDAREIFLNYLKNSLLLESQIGYIRSGATGWARIMNENVEKSVFGGVITRSVYISQKELLVLAKELLKDLLEKYEELDKDSEHSSQQPQK